MLIAILIVILALAILSLFSERLPKSYHNYILWGTIVVFVVICMTKGNSYDTDYLNYEKYFYSFDDKITQISVEPTFLWLCEKIYGFGGTVNAVINIYILLSIPLKLYAIRKLTSINIYILSVIVYASNYFMLHDCEQIRIAAAWAFGMYAIYLKVENNKWWIALVLIGTSFHHTLAALFIPLIFCPKDLGAKWKVILSISIPISILLWAAHINIISALPIPYIETKLKLYEIAIANGNVTEARVINIMVLFRIVLFYYLLYYYDEIRQHIKCFPVLMFCFALSIFTWFALSTMSVIAVRMSQLYGFVEVILFSCIYYTVRPNWVGKSIVILLSLYSFVQFYIYNVHKFG